MHSSLPGSTTIALFSSPYQSAQQASNHPELDHNSIITRTKSSKLIIPILIELHWLPVKNQIDLKNLLLTDKAPDPLAHHPFLLQGINNVSNPQLLFSPSKPHASTPWVLGLSAALHPAHLDDRCFLIHKKYCF